MSLWIPVLTALTLGVLLGASILYAALVLIGAHLERKQLEQEAYAQNE